MAFDDNPKLNFVLTGLLKTVRKKSFPLTVEMKDCDPVTMIKTMANVGVGSGLSENAAQWAKKRGQRPLDFRNNRAITARR
jgi:hypothetical protein